MLGKLPYANSAKGEEARGVLSDERAIVTQDYGGKWYHLSKQGMVFSGTGAAAGIVLPIYSATAQLFGIWNPAGSGVNVSILSIAACYKDTTGAAGGFCLGINKNIGSAIATGGISAFTEGVPDKAIVGSGSQGGSKVLFTPSGATTIAPTLWRQLGINQLVLTAAEDEMTIFEWYRAFDGECSFGPGNAVWVCGNIATLSKWVPTIVWAEIPI